MHACVCVRARRSAVWKVFDHTDSVVTGRENTGLQVVVINILNEATYGFTVSYSKRCFMTCLMPECVCRKFRPILTGQVVCFLLKTFIGNNEKNSINIFSCFIFEKKGQKCEEIMQFVINYLRRESFNLFHMILSYFQTLLFSQSLQGQAIHALFFQQSSLSGSSINW